MSSPAGVRRTHVLVIGRRGGVGRRGMTGSLGIRQSDSREDVPNA